jgi:hypothetical protein
LGTKRGTPSKPRILVCRYPMSCTLPETAPAYTTDTSCTNETIPTIEIQAKFHSED